MQQDRVYLTFEEWVLEGRQGNVEAQARVWQALANYAKIELIRAGFRGDALEDVLADARLDFLRDFRYVHSERALAIDFVKKRTYTAMRRAIRSAVRVGEPTDPETLAGFSAVEIEESDASPMLERMRSRLTGKQLLVFDAWLDVLQNGRGLDESTKLASTEMIAQRTQMSYEAVKAAKRRLKSQLGELLPLTG